MITLIKIFINTILNLIFIKSMTEEFINNTIEPCILPNTIAGCINRNFCSSFLFLFPALYGYYVNYTSIIIGSTICLFTSTAHHYYQAHHKILQMIDRICVELMFIYVSLLELKDKILERLRQF